MKQTKKSNTKGNNTRTAATKVRSGRVTSKNARSKRSTKSTSRGLQIFGGTFTKLAVLGLFVFAGVFGYAAGSLSSAPFANSATTTPTRLFFDDFIGSAGSLPDQTKWLDYSTCTNGPVAAWGKIRCGNDEKLNGKGQLVVPATPSYGTGLQTKGKFSFLYGTVTARIKMPTEPGYWPAFWMINPNPNDSKAFYGEIDVSEVYTTWPNISHVNTHGWNTGGAKTGSGDKYCTSNVSLSDGYHKYSTRIEPGKITFMFDDKICSSYVTTDSYASKGAKFPFGPDNSNKHFLILNVAVGGADGTQTPATKPTQMLVGSVEVTTNPTLPSVYKTNAKLMGKNNMCVGPRAGGTANGTQIEIQTCTSSNSQRFDYTTTGQLKIRSTANKCIDVQGNNSTTNGTKIQLYDCNNGAEKWTYTGTEFKAPGGKCLDLVNGNPTPGTKLDLWDCNSSDGQKWWLIQ